MEEKTIQWTEPYYPSFEEVKREMIKDARKGIMGFLKMLGITVVVLTVVALHIWFFTEYLALGEENGVPLGVGSAIGLWLALPGGMWVWYGSVIDRLRHEKEWKEISVRREAENVNRL